MNIYDFKVKTIEKEEVPSASEDETEGSIKKTIHNLT